MRHNVQVIAMGHQVDVQRIKSAPDLAAFVTTARARMGQPAAQTSATQRDPMEQLRKLAELRDAAVIMSEDFEAKKADLLKQI